MSETLIKVEYVSKKFCRDLKRSLFYGLTDMGSELFGRNASGKNRLRKKEFWAVDDINFEVKRGECLGLIGKNGAGKSTLLKMLNGLIKPDTGRIEMHGRIGALIELGAGFNPVLTGRENIYNNAAVIGITKKETDQLLEEIIEFSEIADFIDTPVQYYSSGMKVRLGFSVAVHLKPDILLLDEVLAVGDAGFRMKSFNKIAEIMQDAAVIFVSHSMQVIATVCTKVMLLRNGQKEYSGTNVHKAIEKYFEVFEGQQARIEFNEGAEIHRITINNKEDNPLITHRLPFYGSFTIEFDVILKQECEQYFIAVQITDKDLKIVAQFKSEKLHEPFKPEKQSRIKIDFTLLHLIDGEYTITYFISGQNRLKPYNKRILATYRHYSRIKIAGLNSDLYAAYYMDGQIYQDGQPVKRLELISNDYDE